MRGLAPRTGARTAQSRGARPRHARNASRSVVPLDRLPSPATTPARQAPGATEARPPAWREGRLPSCARWRRGPNSGRVEVGAGHGSEPTRPAGTPRAPCERRPGPRSEAQAMDGAGARERQRGRPPRSAGNQQQREGMEGSATADRQHGSSGRDRSPSTTERPAVKFRGRVRDEVGLSYCPPEVGAAAPQSKPLVWPC